MHKIFILILASFASLKSFAKNTTDLRQKIDKIILAKDATVGVSIRGIEDKDSWSPIRDDFPNGNLHLTLYSLVRSTVSHSDNKGCDILLDLMGNYFFSF